jgi:hypothetical protein
MSPLAWFDIEQGYQYHDGGGQDHDDLDQGFRLARSLLAQTPAETLIQINAPHFVGFSKTH